MVPFTGVVSKASRKEPGPLSARLVTVLGNQRSSSASIWGRQRNGDPGGGSRSRAPRRRRGREVERGSQENRRDQRMGVTSVGHMVSSRQFRIPGRTETVGGERSENVLDQFNRIFYPHLPVPVK